jgi:predicted N-formylglutamate amidohydrolase
MRLPPPDADKSYVETLEGQAARPLLILCDHAGHEVPGGAAALGISEAELARHIGWDIGAADLTRALARRLGCAAVLNHCSRLVIDCNRRPRSPTSVPPVSDGCVIPANQGLDAEHVRERARRYFLPYHRAIARRIAAFRGRGQVPALIAVHSFTRRLVDGEDRPWQVGVLWRGDRRLAEPVLEALTGRGDLVVGDNEPYSGLGAFGFTIEFHAQRPRLPHIMFEIRQDEIATRERAEAYAAILAEALKPALADPALHTLYDEPAGSDILEAISWRQGSLL